MNVLQELYDSEINFKIATFWDGGFDWCLGDRMNGIKDSGNEDTLVEALNMLKESAIKYYPESTFARKFDA